MEKNLVLDTTAFLVDSPEYVKINNSKIEELAEKFSKEKLEIPAWKESVYLTQTDDKFIDFILLVDSINFAFTDFQTKEKYSTPYNGKECKGAFGMTACIKRAIEQGTPLLDGKVLKDITEKEMKEIFAGNIEIPMLNERTAIFREVGEILCAKYDGRFSNIVKASNGKLFDSGSGLVERLTTEFDSFNDSSLYLGRLVLFDKRAQLAAGMIYGRFLSEGKKMFEDVDELTIFADYVLPKGLRDLGVLEYNHHLTKKVDSQQIIPAGSTSHAAKRITDKINEQKPEGEKINALHMDYRLWNASREANKGSPHHLTPTINY